MSNRGDIIRGAGGILNRKGKTGIGIGAPFGGTEGDIRVRMVDSSPRLYARAGGQWYGVGLEKGTATKEFRLGSTEDYVTITPEVGISVFNDSKLVAQLGKTLFINNYQSGNDVPFRLYNDGIGYNQFIFQGANPEILMGYSGSGASPSSSIYGSSKIKLNRGTGVGHMSNIAFADNGSIQFVVGGTGDELRIIAGDDPRTDADCTIRIDSNGYIGFAGTTPAARPGYGLANMGFPDRTISYATATLGEVRETLCTLISDLITMGLLRTL